MFVTVACALAGLLAVAQAQLQCHPETLSYKYVNNIKLWGSVAQHYTIWCMVDIDCDGASELSSVEAMAFDYLVHMYDVKIKVGKVDARNTASLCPQRQDGTSSCTIGEGSGQDNTHEQIVETGQEFTLPFRFTQDQFGRVLRIEFMEADFENHDVMNMKKGIISSLQTRIAKRDETNITVTAMETDSTGFHTSYYRSRQLDEGVVIEKQYQIDDGSRLSRLTKAAQVQVKTATLIQNGEIVDSQGEVTSSLWEDEEEEVSPDDITVDLKLDELLWSNSKFDLQLALIKERSSLRRKRMAEYRRLTFLPTSLEMDSTDDSEDIKYLQLSDLYNQLKQQRLENVLLQFLSSGDEDQLVLIKNVISLETEMGFTNVQEKLSRQEGPTVDSLVASTYGVMSSCGTKWDRCRAILEVYTVGGRRMAEEVFEFFLSPEANLTEDQQIDVTNLAASMANPSDRFVLSLVHLLTQMPEDSDRFSSLLLTLGSLAGHPSVADTAKEIVIAIILKRLQSIQPEHCTEEASHADALEAIGNMGDVRFVDRLMEVDSACPKSKVMHVALVHAMRNMLEEPRVLSFMTETLSSFECDVAEDMLNMLLEELQDQQLDDSNMGKWPLTGFNDFDQALSWMLLHTPDRLSCLKTEAIRYFRNKLSPPSGEISETLSSKLNGESVQHMVTKRGIKKHSSCSTWSDFSGRYKSLQSASQFTADSKTFENKKHCLAHFGIGPSKANINVYAGYFAGFSKVNNRCKLFAKIVANGQVLKKKFTIGTVYLYFNTKGKSNNGRVYAKVGKKTFIDKKFKVPKYKSTKKLYSSPEIKIPLLKIGLYTAKISVTLKLSAKIELTTELRTCKSGVCLSFKPKAIGKASGSASISLAVVRGGANLNFNLNYFLLGEARARKAKKPCVALSHGNDKNTINLEFYYQVKSKVKVKVKVWPPKIKFEWKWGKKKTWAPSSLKWKLSAAKAKKIHSSC